MELSDYNLELERVAAQIKKQKAKRVLLQFPEGLKPIATAVADILKEKTNAEIMIWFDSCFGACDTPIGIEKLGVGLVVQFGHSKWKK